MKFGQNRARERDHALCFKYFCSSYNSPMEAALCCSILSCHLPTYHKLTRLTISPLLIWSSQIPHPITTCNPEAMLATKYAWLCITLIIHPGTTCSSTLWAVISSRRPKGLQPGTSWFPLITPNINWGTVTNTFNKDSSFVNPQVRCIRNALLWWCV